MSEGDEDKIQLLKRKYNNCEIINANGKAVSVSLMRFKKIKRVINSLYRLLFPEVIRSFNR